MRYMLKSKIHRAIVTDSDLHYEGSITLDTLLMEAADIRPYERLEVLNINNGARFQTYAIQAGRGSGIRSILDPARASSRCMRARSRTRP